MDRDFDLRRVKEEFCQFRSDDFFRNDKIFSVQTSGIDNDLIHDLANIYPRSTTEVIAEKLNVDNSIAFCHLK